jgi:MoaD family protein
MRVKLETKFVPQLAKALGKDKLEFEFEGKSVKDLLSALSARFGKRAREALYESNGSFTPEIQIILNGRRWVRKDKLHTRLKDGDTVTFLLFLAGG